MIINNQLISVARVPTIKLCQTICDKQIHLTFHRAHTHPIKELLKQNI